MNLIRHYFSLKDDLLPEKESGIMKTGEIVCANTHAEFLNKAFGTNYKGYLKSRWNYTKDTVVWMVEIDGKVRNGWRNKIVSDDEIIEEYVGTDNPSYDNTVEKRFRIVVNVIKGYHFREYHVLGKYELDQTVSDRFYHRFLKVETNYL